jgi:uncharacterized membrane protein YiaA
MTDKIKPIAPYVGSLLTVVIAIVGGWNAMNMRLAETESKIKVLELQQRQYVLDEKRQDDKLETLQNYYITSGQQYAIIATKLEMLLTKTK